jgi:hypothetical protein
LTNLGYFSDLASTISGTFISSLQSTIQAGLAANVVPTSTLALPAASVVVYEGSATTVTTTSHCLTLALSVSMLIFSVVKGKLKIQNKS